MVHLGYHAESKLNEPSSSYLYVRDDGAREAETLTVRELGAAIICNAQLASIFACLTAETAVDQFHDESINIANAFQLSWSQQCDGRNLGG
jgi:hypothetical protein